MRRVRRKARVQPRARHHHAEAVRTDQPQSVRARRLRGLVRERARSMPEPCRDDDRAAASFDAGGSDDAGDCGGRRRDDDEVGRVLQPVDAWHGDEPVDLRMTRIDQMQRSGKSGLAQVVQNLAADRGFARACADQRNRSRRQDFLESVCTHRNRSELICRRSCPPSKDLALECPQCVENDRDVYDFLKQGTLNWRDIPQRSGKHSGKRKSDPCVDTLKGNEARARRDLDRRHDAIKLIDQKHDIRGFGRSGGPSCTHGNANVGGSKSGRIIDTVADHHHRSVLALRQHDHHFLVGRQFRAHGTERKPCCDSFGHLAPVAGRKHGTLDPQFPEIV